VQGIIHFGMWVDSLERSDAAITEAGGKYLTGRQEGEISNPDVYYEVKYTTPEGFVFDITETGWKGAVKDVVPAPDSGREMSGASSSAVWPPALPSHSSCRPRHPEAGRHLTRRADFQRRISTRSLERKAVISASYIALSSAGRLGSRYVEAHSEPRDQMDVPDPQTLVIDLRLGVLFHDGTASTRPPQIQPRSFETDPARTSRAISLPSTRCKSVVRSSSR